MRKNKSIDIEEFRFLVMNLIPTTRKEQEWICSTIERLTYEHPELKRKVEEWGAAEKTNQEFINRILRRMGLLDT